MTDFTKNLPLGTKTIPTVPDDTETNFIALEERLGQEHLFPLNADLAHAGRHTFGWGTAAARDAAITTPREGMIWTRSDMPGIVEFYDGSAWVPHGTAVGTEAARVAVTSPSTNAIWQSTDGGRWLWNGSAWVALSSITRDYIQKDGSQTISTTKIQVSDDALVVTPATNELTVAHTAPAAGTWNLDINANASVQINEVGSPGTAFSFNIWVRIDDGTVTVDWPLGRINGAVVGSDTLQLGANYSLSRTFPALTNGDTYTVTMWAQTTGAAGSIVGTADDAATSYLTSLEAFLRGA